MPAAASLYKLCLTWDRFLHRIAGALVHHAEADVSVWLVFRVLRYIGVLAFLLAVIRQSLSWFFQGNKKAGLWPVYYCCISLIL